MAKQPIKIVVLGAGYAGMLGAVRLAGRVKREICSDVIQAQHGLATAARLTLDAGATKTRS